LRRSERREFKRLAPPSDGSAHAKIFFREREIRAAGHHPAGNQARATVGSVLCRRHSQRVETFMTRHGSEQPFLAGGCGSVALGSVAGGTTGSAAYETGANNASETTMQK
jgi:hypothetical protein